METPNVPAGNSSRKNEIEILHGALRKLRFKIADDELRSRKLGETSARAIAELQRIHGIPVDGVLNDATKNILKAESFHTSHVTNKTRTARLHGLLEKAGVGVARDEKSKRMAGAATLEAIKKFQEKNGLKATGKVDEDTIGKLHEEAIRATFSTKTQIGGLHKTLLNAGRIGKLKLEISADEIKNKVIGPSTKAALKTFQEKYKLKPTGELDKDTLDRIQSVVTSRGVKEKLLKSSNVQELRTVKTNLRLNMRTPKVEVAQKALAGLGFKINESEFKTQTFGKSTRNAVVAFQKSRGLAPTGHIENDTLKLLNQSVMQLNPEAKTLSYTGYRVRGSVRNALWERKPNMVIKVFEQTINGPGAQPLVTKKNMTNGFFDILYNPPVDPVTKLPKTQYHLMVQLWEPVDNNSANDKLISTQIHYNAKQTHWVNFTQSDEDYKGDSDFETQKAKLEAVVGVNNIKNIEETENKKQVTQLNMQTGLSTEDIMRQVIAHKIAASVNVGALTAEVFYAFLRQGLPSGLPGDLLRATSGWETIGQMVDQATTGIAFTEDGLMEQVLDSALQQNLVSQRIKLNKATIVAALKTLRTTFTLTKPILIGKGNLKSLLDESAIAPQHYNTVAQVFIANRGINPDFWSAINAHAGAIGQSAIEDFATTVQVGNISKNHQPTFTFLKNKIGTGKQFKRASDIAKLDKAALTALITTNNNTVPDNIPGNNTNEKVTNFAAVMKARAEMLYPAVSLVAEAGRTTNKLTKIPEIETFIDAQPALDLKHQNIDKYLLDKNINLEAKTKEELKVVQRVHKLTDDPRAGAGLLDKNLHSSRQVYFMGKEQVANILTPYGVDEKQAKKLYEVSKMQYMQILSRIIDFRPETNFGTPQVIIPQTYSKSEAKSVLGDIPSLETLFGTLDFCDCEHCSSLYGPAAYFTDMLRFLHTHDSLVKQGTKTLTVREILFDRRPDLGNIKLNCENTNTALPYIDLVCEILENNIAPAQKNFSYQTTLSQKELKAMPQYIRTAAYDTLAAADFPMNYSFNLYQEEARTYLNFLRTPRYELMETFQDISNQNAKAPDDVSIAAEYFGISSYEKDLIINSKQTNVDQDKYWGNDDLGNPISGQTQVGVALFMKRTKLTYNEVLELLLVKFVNDPLNNKSVIERPVDTCDTDAQKITNINVAKLDRAHRFVRLWRKSGLKMWELDLAIRNGGIGAGVINDTALVNLKKFKQLQEKLNMPFETLLAFYSAVNTEQRVRPEKPDVIVQPVYEKMFQNQAVTNPIDAKFALANDRLHLVNETLPLGLNAGYTPVPTILSALAITQSDFDMLANRPGNVLTTLSVSSLSTLVRYAYLAKGLRMSVKDMLLLLTITNVTNPFSSIQATLDCIKNAEYIKASGLSLIEMDYILNYNPASSAGLRTESLVQLIDLLRKILSSNKEKIDKLSLTAANRDQILNFNADGLAPMTNPQLVAAFTPLQTLLTAQSAAFTNAGFSQDEVQYLTSFDTTTITAAGKAKLIETIKTLQKNLSDLLEQSSNQIKSQVASSFSVPDEQVVILLDLHRPGNPQSLLEQLSNENLLAKNPDGTYKDITFANFPDQFNAYSLLHKIALLIGRMKIDTRNLKWFAANSTAVKTLDLAALPIAAAAPPNAFTGWLNLHKFLRFASAYPEPEETSIRKILDLAKNPASAKTAIMDEIALLTQWKKNDLVSIDTGFKLKQQVGTIDYADAELYQRLQKCAAQINLTGVDAATLFRWSASGNNLVQDAQVSLETRNAIKSKYEQEDWLDKIGPLYDDVREKKRRGLVEYHLENSQRTQPQQVLLNGKMIPNPLYWKDSNSLFKYLLIDVEMCSCQLTSRIKQALSSVQLFVQRCFLNLESRYVKVTQDEKEDVTSPNAWSQWKWMKNYRIWEANRKIFFYPENWLEPELRDDKSPFFYELENELMQNEINSENVETAFLSYLHKVDDVANLEVCGTYHQMEDLAVDSEGLFEINTVHVVGRTQAIPHVYYYRSYDVNYATWTAWEKIEVDITGDHLVPVVYNRKLHLFWLVFNEKAKKASKVPAAKASAGPTDAPEPMKILEVQLGWTVRKQDGWSTKKISKQKLVHPWERPYFSYNLRPYYLAKFNELYLDIYLSTSSEFNDGTFYDPVTDKRVKLTKNPFNETFLPWHSSSFIFNGEVKDVKMKGLGGFYIISGQELWLSDSYDYVYANFGEAGRQIKELDPAKEYGPRLRLPGGMHFHNTRLTNNRNNAVNNSELRVLENNATTTILKNASANDNSSNNAEFQLVVSQQDLQLNTLSDHPMFYQDSRRAFFILPEWQNILNNYGQVINKVRKYRFKPFYHPYTTLFIRELNRDGIDGLLKRKIQVSPNSYAPASTFNFNHYSPNSNVIVEPAAQTDTVDFTLSGAYSIYNWELFFHAPLMIACRLMQNQKFEDAMRWFHYIFDPTNVENLPTPQRYWITKPFFEYNSDDYRKQRIENILTNLNLPENRNALIAWKNNPFQPHLIARSRPVAYQKNVVMKYLDNLIAWGDQLFRRDTIESINEASLLYMLAYEILGDRPIKVPNVKREDLSYNELETKLDDLANAKVDVVVEDTLLPISVTPSASSGSEPLPKIEVFYFSIPNNDYLVKYWDTVEDRLFKIHHCMNIEGVVRQLPLFEPPIDPALLVKAAAAGMDLGSVLNEINAPAPHYRFRVVMQKALEFCNEVKQLGDKLLSVLEKKDAEGLAILRSQHEIQLLEAVREIRKKQIDEVVENIGSLQQVFAMADEKKTYYEGREMMNGLEIAGSALSGASAAVSGVTAIGEIIASQLHLIPSFSIGISGFGGSPQVTMSIGGSMFASAVQAADSSLTHVGSMLSQVASMLNTIASYQRRKDEWDFQGRLANIEKNQIQFQINAAEIRQAIAEKELENQEMQIDNAKTVDDYMRNKYTNQQLYNWMISQVSAVYFQAYQLAFDMAKKAEKCYQRELGVQSSNFIQFGYWDSLRKGLLSGERLMTDLMRLEAAYIDQNKRELEITKHISLAQILPMSLITLKETGECTLSLPEWLFDMDYPGHYMRRIKNVSISIPCITGPYTGVNCTLSLLRNEIRIDPTGAYAKTDENDPRFKVQFGATSSIATSSAQNDAGMFELNFNDERYLPFEGSGAVSDWKISMPRENNYFDFASIADVVLHISYTARSSGGQLATNARANLNTVLPDSTARLFSLKHEFSTEWYKFLNPENGADQELVITLKPEHFPFFIRSKLSTLKHKGMDVFIETTETGDFKTDFTITNATAATDITVSPDTNFHSVHHLSRDLSGTPPAALGQFKLKLKKSGVNNYKSLPVDLLDNVYVVFQLGA